MILSPNHSLRAVLKPYQGQRSIPISNNTKRKRTTPTTSLTNLDIEGLREWHEVLWVIDVRILKV